MINKILLLIFFTAFYNLSYSQPIIQFIDNFYKFTENNSFEKIYVQTDKANYFLNEYIYFKIYNVNSKNLKLDSLSNIAFIELISPECKIIFRKNLMLKNGTASGYFYIPDTIQNGVYQIRCFTNSMKNFSSEFFFTKRIKINTANNFYSIDFYKSFKKFNRNKDKIELRYKINNSEIIYGFSNEIEYFINNNFTKYSNPEIYIIDNQKNICSEILNSKYGLLDFVPDKEKKYFIILKSDNRVIIKQKLPDSQKKNFYINITENKNEFVLNFNFYENLYIDSNKKYYVFIENNGAFNFNEYKLNSSQIIVDKKNLFAGISNLYVFDKYGNQLYFNKIYIEKVTKTFDNITYKIENETIEIVFDSIENEIFSLSASLSNDIDSYTNISDYLFYKSDVAYIESSFVDYNNKKNYNISNTSKYDIISIMKDTSFVFEFKKQNSLKIEGYISNIIEKNPAKFANVTIRILNSYNDFFETKTDENGNFYFDNLNYSDSIIFYIESKTQNDKKHTVISVKDYDTFDIHFQPFIEMDIKHVRIKKNNVDQQQTSSDKIYSYADQIIYSKDFENSGAQNVFEVLKGKVPGIKVNESSAIIRGYSSILLPSEPLYLIDNCPVSGDAIASLDLNNVDRIEIVKNPSSLSIYGQRGANGIISVYTKKGYNIDWGKYNGAIPGIFKDKKFEITSDTNIFVKTFYWNSNIKIDNTNNKIKIPLDKKQKNYVLIIQGIGSNGRIIDYKLNIEL